VGGYRFSRASFQAPLKQGDLLTELFHLPVLHLGLTEQFRHLPTPELLLLCVPCHLPASLALHTWTIHAYSQQYHSSVAVWVGGLTGRLRGNDGTNNRIRRNVDVRCQGHFPVVRKVVVRAGKQIETVGECVWIGDSQFHRSPDLFDSRENDIADALTSRLTRKNKHENQTRKQAHLCSPSIFVSSHHLQC